MAKTSDVTLIENTHANLTADTRVYGPDFQLSPTDTADAGKHKLCDGVNTYAGLSFIEDGGVGGGITQLTGAVTAGPGSGSQATTLSVNAVTTSIIANGNVTDQKLASMTAGTLKGRAAGGGPGAPETITPTDELALSGATIGLRIEALTAGAPAPDDLLIFADITAGNAKKAATIAQATALKAEVRNTASALVSGVYLFDGVTDAGTGLATFDLTAVTPPLSAAQFITAFPLPSSGVSWYGILANETTATFSVQFYDYATDAPVASAKDVRVVVAGTLA